ncbi:MAG: site-specific DNA-methyltransferase [Candidatus Korobacteraceae bacterium]
MNQALQANEIYHGDARELLPSIEANTIACSIWSPPYFVGKSYEKYLNSYADWRQLLADVVRLHFPIIRPGGFVVINIADILCFADPKMPRIQAETVNQRRSPVSKDDVLLAKTKFPNYNRDQLAATLGCSEQTIDRRLNGNNIRGGKYATQTRVKMVAGAVEMWARRAGFYLYDRRVWVKDPAWQNCEWHSSSYRSVDEFEYLYFLWKPGITVVDRRRLSTREWAEWGSRGVWFIPSVRSNGDHEAKFPLELPKRLIKMLSDPGDTVLDCFMGSGTTAVAALKTGRQYIGIERLSKYVEMARKACGTFTGSSGTAEEDQGECLARATQPMLLSAES